MQARSDYILPVLIIAFFVACLGTAAVYTYRSTTYQRVEAEATYIACRDASGMVLELNGGLLVGASEGSGEVSNRILISIEYNDKFYDFEVPYGLALKIAETSKESGTFPVIVYDRHERSIEGDTVFFGLNGQLIGIIK